MNHVHFCFSCGLLLVKFFLPKYDGVETEVQIMIYFDRKSLSILKYIKRRGDRGASWGKIREKYGDDAVSGFLESLSIELYIVTKNEKGAWVDFEKWNHVILDSFISYSTSKGNELIEKRCFNFWKWVIPTLISIVALAVSFIGVIYKLPKPQQVPQPQKQVEQYSLRDQSDGSVPASVGIQNQR